MRGLKQNQIITLDFISQNNQRKKLYRLDDFKNETPTHMGATHANLKLKQKFKTEAKILKSNSQGIGPNFWYPQNQRELLIHIHIFDGEKSTGQKSYQCL